MQRRFIHIDFENNAALQAAFAGFGTGDKVTCRVQFVVETNDTGKGLTGIITGAGEPEERPAVDPSVGYSPESGKPDAALIVLMKGKGSNGASKSNPKGKAQAGKAEGEEDESGEKPAGMDALTVLGGE